MVTFLCDHGLRVFRGVNRPPECRPVATLELSVNPAKADRLVECAVVGEHRRLRRALLGQNEPDPFDRRGGATARCAIPVHR